MSRLPRRPPRIRPLRRGRSAAEPSVGGPLSERMRVFHQRPSRPGRSPSRSGRLRWKPHKIWEPPKNEHPAQPSLPKLPKQQPEGLKVLDQPWKWGAFLVVLVILLLLIGLLL
ncbi:MAG: hypothetical protein QNJ46_09750 [Leptolyngbyaceae cyanobacterium MO_188.B28]|nr:hypothetical protein [Leptolyngbyaceae cyanobacterium MO_188.B28]